MTFTSAQMKRAIAQICEADPEFTPIIEASPLCSIGRTQTQSSHFESLVESVISQQLAIHAADTIHARLVSLAGGKITPSRIAKAKTIQGLSKAALTRAVEIAGLHLLDDELVSQKLNSLWGIGPWTVDMFMMFQLGRLDTWPTGDLGVRRGWEKIHRLKEQIEPKKLQIQGEIFRPYRSVVAWYCWRAVESK
jgi:DNA-3-methyladenine glycosylase II